MFKKIVQFFKNLFFKIQGNKQVQEFEEFCGEVFTAEKALILASLKNFALQAVQTAETTGLDSASKRNQAFNSISAQAQTAGVTTGASMIFLALEMAVTALRNKQNDNQGVVVGT